MPDAPRPLTSGLRHPLAALIVAVLAACGSPPGNSNTPATDTAPAAATAPAPAAAPTEPVPAAAEAAAANSGVQEESTASPGGEQIRLASAAATPEPQWRFQAGRDFKAFTAAQGTTSPPDKIEVAEVFWYGCSHCYQFDPMIEEWKKKLPGDVSLVRVPVMWNPTNQIHARVYYAAQALGKLEEMHTPIFREIHVNGKTLTTEEEIENFFGKFGVSSADFQKAFRSFAVESQLKRAKDLTQRYEVRSVPLLIVNGRYSTDAPGLKNYDDMLAVVGELIERERRR
jgi:thiol:disulfide interchange protein DsbA